MDGMFIYKNLSKEAFRNGRKLLVLDLSKNKIRKLHQDTFFLAEQLMELDLSKNLLQSIDVHAFSGLGYLQKLNLEHNKLELIPENSFASLIQLKSIRMSHNSIKMIPVELFRQNMQLQDIYLNDNEIEWLFGEQTFRHLPNVNEFDFHNNPIENSVCFVVNAQLIDIRHTNSMCCYIGSRTKRILANNNQISYIDSNDATSTSTTTLEHVDLASNNLPKMENLSLFENLIYLDLTNNSISDIGINSFARMHRLEKLALRKSGLSNIYFGLFSHKLKLKYLDISYNTLTHIDFRMFVSMRNLVKLHLDGNNITELDVTEMRKIFPALLEISISENNWYCENLGKFLLQIESFGITLKTIGSVKNSENISGIPCSTASHGTSTQKNLLSDENSTENSEENTCLVSEVISTDQHLNISDMNIIVRLMELKYDIQIITQSANEISKKVENILKLI